MIEIRLTAEDLATLRRFVLPRGAAREIDRAGDAGGDHLIRFRPEDVIAIAANLSRSAAYTCRMDERRLARTFATARPPATIPKNDATTAPTML